MDNLWDEISKAEIAPDELEEEINSELYGARGYKARPGGKIELFCQGPINECEHSKSGFRKIFRLWTDKEKITQSVFVCYAAAERFNSILSDEQGVKFYELLIQGKYEFIEYSGKPGVPCQHLQIKLFNRGGSSVIFKEKTTSISR
jgi:hypothetical protein